MSTMCIVSNWKRPENLSKILPELINQTVPFDKIIIVDNSDSAEYTAHIHPYKDKDGNYQFTDVWKFPDNGMGPPCRFMPAILDYRFDRALFLDDDFISGRRMHEFLLEQDERLDSEFATIGQIGRILGNDSQSEEIGQKFKYIVRDVPRHPTDPKKVDITCRAHYCHRDLVIDALHFRDQIMDGSMPTTGLRANWQRHDDILLSLGIQESMEWPSYIIPACEAEQAIIKQNLDDKEHAMHLRSGHIESRQFLINHAVLEGWWTQLDTR